MRYWKRGGQARAAGCLPIPSAPPPSTSSAVWAERAGAEFVRGEPGGDPAAVAFDAVQGRAWHASADVVLHRHRGAAADRTPALMDELAKISRVVVKKEVPDAPHEVLLVLDANTGQNAIRQAQEFRARGRGGAASSSPSSTARRRVASCSGSPQEVGIPGALRRTSVRTSDDLVDFDVGALSCEALFASD